MKLLKLANVTILNISKYKFEPQGFTILALLAESHISFHTFPEKGIISFDFFTCGNVSPSVALDIIKKEFKHKRIVKKNLIEILNLCIMIFIAHLDYKNHMWLMKFLKILNLK